MDSLEPISLAELRRRLTRIIADSAHLRDRLPPDSPHNAVLRLSDVARYIRVPLKPLQRVIPERPPRNRCHFGCATVNACRREGRCRPFGEGWQIALSRFFWALDRGNIRKIRVGDEWRIENSGKGDGALSQVVSQTVTTAAPRRPHELRIDLTKVGPRLKVR